MRMLKTLRASRALAVAAACIGIFTLGIQQAQATVITSGCTVTNVSCTFDELFVGGATISVDDKRFDRWSLARVEEFTPDFSQINVFGLDADPLNPGLRYEGNGQLITPFIDPNAQILTTSLLPHILEFSFLVSTISGDPLIKDNSLTLVDFDLEPLSANAGSIQIEEGVTDLFGRNQLASKIVAADNFSAPDPIVLDLFDQATFAPQSAINVQTKVSIIIENPFIQKELRVFEQRFSQVGFISGGPPGGVIPEPGTFSLLGIGLAGLALHQWRRKKWASQ